jgi:hypothetical protein
VTSPLLFGVLGATLAAPVTAVTLGTISLLSDAGLFGTAVTPPEGREASAGPAVAD